MSATLEIQDDVALITLNDGKANAVSPAFLANANAALDEAEAKAKAIVFAGRAGVFSGGFDLAVMRGSDRAQVASLVQSGGALALRLFACKTPTVVACTGHAIAMGAFLLLAFDTRIGAAGAYRIGLNETAIGMALPAWGFELLRARLLARHATAAVVQAHLFDPEGAVEAGFLDEIVAEDMVIARALERGRNLASLPGQAYARNKYGLRGHAIDALKSALQAG